MNRAERRRGKWHKLTPILPYDQFTADVGENATKVMMLMLRQMAGEDAPFTDAEIWNSTRELINHGLLNVYFRFHWNGDLEIQPEFLMPSLNDNRPSTGGHAA